MARDFRLEAGIALSRACSEFGLTTQEMVEVLDTRPDLPKLWARQMKEAALAIKGRILVAVGDVRSSQELLSAGRYDYYNPEIVRLCSQRSAREKGDITIENIEFDHNWTFEEGLAELERRGLGRLEWDDLPLLCEQNPDLQHTHWMVSSMVPVAGSVLYANGDPGHRYLGLDSVQGSWVRGYVLLGVRE